MKNKILNAIDKGLMNVLSTDIQDQDIDFDTSDIDSTPDRDLQHQMISDIIEAGDYAQVLKVERLNGYEYFYKASQQDLSEIVHGCIKVDPYCNLNWIDTSEITDMSFLFQNKKFDGDISEWNTEKVFTMAYMFKGSTYTGQNGDISNWNTDSLANMTAMFKDSHYIGDLSGWTFKRLVQHDKAFYKCGHNGQTCKQPVFKDINKLQKEIVTVHSARELKMLVAKAIAKYKRLFDKTQDPNLICDLNWIDVSQISTLDHIFENLQLDFKIDVSKWDVSHITRMTSVFEKSNFDGDISEWDVSNVTSMINMFKGNKSFNRDLSNWGNKLKSLKHCGGMFARSNYNQDIRNWDVGNVESMLLMFEYNTSFMYDLSCWNVSKKCQTYNMFHMTNDKLQLPDWYQGPH